MKKNKGFTLIELLAVIVILAIISLITIPIVIKTINNSTEESEKQSIMGYARAIEADSANFILKNSNKRYADYVITNTLEYKGNTVICSNSDGQVFQENKLVLLNCYVTSKKREEITDIEEEGKNKNHYNYDNGKITKISNDNNENNNSNSNTYEVYNVGDRIQVAGDTSGDYYYVIASSDASQDYVVALKENPLTVEEVNTYGTGHVNQYISSSQGIATNQNGYGGLAYYSSENCTLENNSECSNLYDESEIKYVVDGWENARFGNSDLKEINGYKTRLITIEEYDSFPTESFEYDCCGGCGQCIASGNRTIYNWAYSSQYQYFTMSQYGNSNHGIIVIGNLGLTAVNGVQNSTMVVRPVINLKKTSIK